MVSFKYIKALKLESNNFLLDLVTIIASLEAKRVEVKRLISNTRTAYRIFGESSVYGIGAPDLVTGTKMVLYGNPLEINNRIIADTIILASETTTSFELLQEKGVISNYGGYISEDFVDYYIKINYCE